MNWRSRVAAALLLASAAFAPLHAQATGPDGCLCSVPGEKPPPGDSLPGDEPDETGKKRRKAWGILGAAGLGFLFGLPFGSGPAQGLPFAGAPGEEQQVAAAPGADPAVPAGTIERPGVVAPSVGAPLRDVNVPLPPDTTAVRPAGLVPPKTATHLPLLAAVGVSLVGGGGLLLRRPRRRKRRRKRRVLLT